MSCAIWGLLEEQLKAVGTVGIKYAASVVESVSARDTDSCLLRWCKFLITPLKSGAALAANIVAAPAEQDVLMCEKPL